MKRSLATCLCAVQALTPMTAAQVWVPLLSAGAALWRHCQAQAQFALHTACNFTSIPLKPLGLHHKSNVCFLWTKCSKCWYTDAASQDQGLCKLSELLPIKSVQTPGRDKCSSRSFKRWLSETGIDPKVDHDKYPQENLKFMKWKEQEGFIFV